MNTILTAIKQHAKDMPDHIAYTVYDELPENQFSTDSLTWEELDLYSDRLSGYISAHTNTKTPIVVYGHKNKYMMVCFLACVKSGHAYVPVDVSVPSNRVQDIIDSVEPEIVLSTVKGEFTTEAERLEIGDIEVIISNDSLSADSFHWLTPEETFYIIFTSGSTGKPKGVQITTDCLSNYVQWAQNLGGMDRINSANFQNGGGYFST